MMGKRRIQRTKYLLKLQQIFWMKENPKNNGVRLSHKNLEIFDDAKEDVFCKFHRQYDY